MIVATPRFVYSYVQITSEIWVGTRPEWEDDPRAHEPGWNVLTQGNTVVANRLAIPAAILPPAPPADAPAVGGGVDVASPSRAGIRGD